jgi:hypothetical protein
LSAGANEPLVVFVGQGTSAAGLPSLAFSLKGAI